MGTIDALSKRYVSDSQRFADIFNFAIYDGEKKISSSALRPLDTVQITTLYAGENNASIPVQRYRDVLKAWQVMTDGEMVYVILGTEIQTNIHYAMPVKIGLYDFIQYANQVETVKKLYKRRWAEGERVQLSGGEYLSGFAKTDKLMPVITLVLYFGTDPWDGPRSIHEMLNTDDEKILQFVADYRIHLLQPSGIMDSDFTKFRTEFGQVFQYIKHTKDKKKLYEITHESDRFSELDKESADLIRAVTGSRLKYRVEGGKVDMRTAIDELIEESMDKGRIEGTLETLETLVKNGMLSVADAAGVAKMSVAEFQQKAGLQKGQ